MTATYQNPILKGDYSDPDVVRVGHDYYMISSSFTYFPGIPVLHSTDLVHWEHIGYVAESLPFTAYETPNHKKGTWAPCIRYHEGTFYVYVCAPDEGLFVFTAKNPAGPWRMHHGANETGWIDPTVLFDDDGQVYLVHAWARSRAAISSRLYLHRMNAEGTKVIDGGIEIFSQEDRHPTTEGPKLYKRNGYYYIMCPAGGVKTGWQLILRSRQIEGPYEQKIVLHQGDTQVNGPHQGGWVDTPEGEDWFIHFQDIYVYGRVPHLQPVHWVDDWPLMGVDTNGDGIGEPVIEYPVPKGYEASSARPFTSDTFCGDRLGLQWQWQANPRREWYSMTENPEALRLNMSRIYKTSTLFHAGQFLSQLMQHYDFDMTVEVDWAGEEPGDRAGIAMMGYTYRYLALEKGKQGLQIALYQGETQEFPKGSECDERVWETKLWSRELPEGKVYLKMQVRSDFTGEHPEARVQFAYSVDGQHFETAGDTWLAVCGGWVSARPGIFAANFEGRISPGYADFRNCIIAEP